jgi:Na+/proline symporter
MGLDDVLVFFIVLIVLIVLPIIGIIWINDHSCTYVRGRGAKSRQNKSGCKLDDKGNKVPNVVQKWIGISFVTISGVSWITLVRWIIMAKRKEEKARVARVARVEAAAKVEAESGY